MAVAMAFFCRRAGSQMVGGGGWIGKMSKVAGALSTRGMCEAHGRRLIAKIIFKSVLRVASKNQSRPLQYWLAFICLFIITVLTGLAITLNIWQDPDFDTAISTLPALSRSVSDLVYGQSQDRSSGLLAVAIIAAVILHTLSRSVFPWLCCKQSRPGTHKQKVNIFATGTAQEMDSRYSSPPSREPPVPRNAVANNWPLTNRSYGERDVSFDSEAIAHQQDGIRAPTRRSNFRSIRWAEEVPDQSDTDTFNHGHYSGGTSKSISPIQDPFLEGHNEKVLPEKLNQRLLRKVKSYMTFSPGSRADDSPSITTKKGLTIGQPSEFRSMNDLSPMRLVPLQERQGTPSRASNGPSPTTKKGLAVSHPLGLRSVNNLHLEREITEVKDPAQLDRPIKRKPVSAKNGGLPHLRERQAAISTTSYLEAYEHDHGGQSHHLSPRGPLPNSFGGYEDPTQDDRQVQIAAKRFAQEEWNYRKNGYEQDDLDPYHQEHGNSFAPNFHITNSDDAERWEEKMRRQDETIMAALANDGSCLLLDYNGSGKTVKFEVVTSPNDWTEPDEFSFSSSSDTILSLPNSLCFNSLHSRTKTNNRLSDSRAASKYGKQEKRRLNTLESLYDLNEASNQTSQSHRSSEAYRMSGSSSSNSFATGESPLRSPTRLSSSTTSKTRGGGLFSSFLKKEPSAAALDEYRKREHALRGVNPKDPDAAAKMKVSTRRLPPEAPNPASKEPKKKKGGGPGGNLLVETFRKIDDRNPANFPVVPKPVSPACEPYDQPSNHRGLAEPDTNLRQATAGAEMQPRYTVSGGQQDIPQQDLVLNKVSEDDVAGLLHANEGEEEVNSPVMKTELTRSLAQRRRHRKREERDKRGAWNRRQEIN